MPINLCVLWDGRVIPLASRTRNDAAWKQENKGIANLIAKIRLREEQTGPAKLAQGPCAICLITNTMLFALSSDFGEEWQKNFL